MQVGFLFLTRRHGLKVGIGKQKLTREETFEAAEASNVPLLTPPPPQSTHPAER